MSESSVSKGKMEAGPQLEYHPEIDAIPKSKVSCRQFEFHNTRDHTRAATHRLMRHGAIRRGIDNSTSPAQVTPR